MKTVDEGSPSQDISTFMSEVEKISGSHGGMYKDTTAF
jgi:hypothetical protein